MKIEVKDRQIGERSRYITGFVRLNDGFTHVLARKEVELARSAYVYGQGGMICYPKDVHPSIMREYGEKWKKGLLAQINEAIVETARGCVRIEAIRALARKNKEFNPPAPPKIDVPAHKICFFACGGGTSHPYVPASWGCHAYILPANLAWAAHLKDRLGDLAGEYHRVRCPNPIPTKDGWEGEWVIDIPEGHVLVKVSSSSDPVGPPYHSVSISEESESLIRNLLHPAHNGFGGE